MPKHGLALGAASSEPFPFSSNSLSGVNRGNFVDQPRVFHLSTKQMPPSQPVVSLGCSLHLLSLQVAMEQPFISPTQYFLPAFEMDPLDKRTQSVPCSLTRHQITWQTSITSYPGSHTSIHDANPPNLQYEKKNGVWNPVKYQLKLAGKPSLSSMLEFHKFRSKSAVSTTNKARNIRFGLMSGASA